MGLIISGLFLLAGMVILYGTWRGWKLFVDPPEKLWMFYPYRWFGAGYLLFHNTLVGLLFIMIGLAGFIVGLSR
jgi:hypothetical protein